MEERVGLTAESARLANKFAQRVTDRFVTRLHEILVPVFCPYPEGKSC